MIKALLVEDHQLILTAVHRLLEEVEGIRVVAEATSGEEALTLAKQHRPDVVVMDVNMPGMDGVEATRRLLRIDGNLKIIALTVYTAEPYPSQLLAAGAYGYLTKGCGADEIVTAIRTVHRGEHYLGADIARQMALDGLTGHGTNPIETLSKREMQVMMMLTQGHKVQAISDTLCLSPKTVSTYRARLLEKLGITNDVELTHFAIRHGMINSLSLAKAQGLDSTETTGGIRP